MTSVALTPTWLALSTRRFVTVVVGAVVLLRLALLPGPMRPDEAGYLLVAQGWRSGGPNLYGHYFVDRPPLLIAVYRLAVLIGWPQSVRLLATVAAAVFVLAASWAAHQVTSRPGVRWATLTAAALITTPLLMTQEADGEIFAAPLVMLAVALTLSAVRRRGARSLGNAVAAGLAAGAAVMVKQNFGDAVVFAIVLLVVGVRQRRIKLREAATVAGGGVAGGLLVVLAAVVYVAWSGVRTSVAWTAVFGFRGTALDVIEDHSLHAVSVRAVALVLLGVLSGVAPLLVVLGLEARRRRLKGSPVAWAVGATMLLEVASVASGGSYWPHYLIQIAPMLALAAGLWAPTARRLRAVVAFVMASSVAATTVIVLSGASSAQTSQVVGTWLRDSGRPGDTATMLYGNADAQQASGMTSPYPQLWTLPMRTLDPHLATLRAVLSGRQAPTWVVVWHNLDPWRIDAHGRTRRVLETHYHPVARVCGHQVYLRDGVNRSMASTTRASDSGIDIDMDVDLPGR